MEEDRCTWNCQFWSVLVTLDKAILQDVRQILERAPLIRRTHALFDHIKVYFSCWVLRRRCRINIEGFTRKVTGI